MVTLSPEHLLERARRAAPEPRSDEDLVFDGWAESQGFEGRFHWRFAGPRFLLHEEGSRARTIGATEQQVWIREGTAPPRDLVWGEADQARLFAAVMSGDWTEPSSGVVVTPLADGKLRLTFGRREAILTLDPETFRPRELEVHASFGRPVWRFSAEVVPDTSFPKCIEHHLPAGIVHRFHVERVAREAPASTSAFERSAAPATSGIDASRSAEVEVRRPAHGFLLVQPEIDGRVVGNFIFDTGAGGNVITPRAAEDLGLSRIGSSWLGLAAGAAPGALRQAFSMRLGPLTIDDPTFVEMDLAALSAHAGEEIAGIFGFDFLRRAVVEIEVAGPHLRFFDSATTDESLPWEEIAIYGNHVYAKASFEGHEGWFRLDTGAPQVPILFNGPAVQSLNLLEGRETKQATIGVPGGTMKVAMGQVRDFSLGGHVFGPLPAIFPLEATGAFADRETVGNLGQECLSPFRVRFDYGRRRAAFIERG